MQKMTETLKELYAFLVAEREMVFFFGTGISALVCFFMAYGFIHYLMSKGMAVAYAVVLFLIALPDFLVGLLAVLAVLRGYDQEPGVFEKWRYWNQH